MVKKILLYKGPNRPKPPKTAEYYIGCGRRDMAPGGLRTRLGGGVPHHLVGRVLLRPPIYCHARARPRVHSDASINK